MCAWTDLHSALMFPSPKPVAPLRSISSKKKVSSVKMGFVNTWSRYLEMEIIQVTGYCTDSASFLLLCFTATYPSWDHMQERGKSAFSSLHSFCNLCLLPAFPPGPRLQWGVLVQVSIQENTVLCQNLGLVSCLLYLMLFPHLSCHKTGLKRAGNHNGRDQLTQVNKMS